MGAHVGGLASSEGGRSSRSGMQSPRGLGRLARSPNPGDEYLGHKANLPRSTPTAVYHPQGTNVWRRGGGNTSG
jgi:hypothetical protein